MPIYTLRRRQVVAMPLAACWDFFSNPANLSRITPPSFKFRLHTELAGPIYPGMMIQYTVSPLAGFPVSWLTEITHVRAPHYFSDEQRVGPYALWHHEHFFEEAPGERTVVSDLVTYVPPFWAFGAVLNRLVIAPQLQRLFDFREERLRSPDSFA